MIVFLGIICLTSGLISDQVQAQERSRIRMSFIKNTNSDKVVAITLYSGRGRDMVLLENQLITLTASNNDTTIELAQLTTDSEGIAQLIIEDGYQLPLDEEGFTIIESSFEGNDEYRGSSNDIEIKDLHFEIDFSVEDSVKIVSVLAVELDSSGNKVPVDGLFMYIGVQRLYSILPIGEVMDSDEGVYSIEFPDDIPGDSTGKYTVVARIEDNDYYGSVVKKGDVQWGTSVSFEVLPPPRRLWTDEAPLWMITSVFVILVGAWYHFFLSIYKLNKIRKVAKGPVEK